jgi:UDP-N-acetylmuramate: L-alanyl-gamma-D-glutamyl-meso-diaminopimelate ligase
LSEDAILIYFKEDPKLQNIIDACGRKERWVPYVAHPYRQIDNKVVVKSDDEQVEINIFGRHNMENMQAAKMVCLQLGVSDSDFLQAMSTFTGAHKRLQLLYDDKKNIAYQDFAHAPSKVRATARAVREKHPNHLLIACVELHTYSSLNASFLSNYAGTLDVADEGIVYYNAHTFEIKKIPLLDKKVVCDGFGGNVDVFTDKEELKKALKDIVKSQTALLFMSSGTFDHMDLDRLCTELF